MSKMQELVDRAKFLQQEGKLDEAFGELIKAIELLSRRQAQLMGDFRDVQHSRTDIPIGCS